MLLSIFSMIGSAQNLVEINGVYYNLTKADSNDNLKNYASIEPRPDGQEYSGNIILPNAIRYEGIEYKVNPRVTPASSTSYLHGPFENSTIKELTIGLGKDTSGTEAESLSH